MVNFTMTSFVLFLIIHIVVNGTNKNYQTSTYIFC